MIGQPVDFQFTAVDGSSVDLRTLRGKVVLVDFWASWCPDCIREMPAIRQTYQKYKDRGFAVVGISLDKDAQALSNFVARKLIPWPQYFDGKGWENDFATKYGVHAIPEMWLINQRGEVVSTDISVDELDQKIEQLMTSEVPAELGTSVRPRNASLFRGIATLAYWVSVRLRPIDQNFRKFTIYDSPPTVRQHE